MKKFLPGLLVFFLFFLFSAVVFGCGADEIDTALGCINVTSPTGFVETVLKFALGIGGGIAFLLMLIGTIQIMTSSGNPDKIKAGQELITSAITGLLLIIFSIFLLGIIGTDILKIPGFAR